MTEVPGLQKCPNGRWKAQIYRGGHNYYLGTFDTEAEARAAREGAQRVTDGPYLHRGHASA